MAKSTCSKKRKKSKIPSPKRKKIYDNGIDITVKFINARFEVGCELKPVEIASKTWNTEIKNGQLTLELASKKSEVTSARIFPSGKITVRVKTDKVEIVKKKIISSI